MPNGSSVDDASWKRRHRGVLVLLMLHVPALSVFGVFQGEGLLHSARESGVLALFVLAASWSRLPRRVRTLAACTGLITASAVLTHLWQGTIESHFHFFVMLGVIAIYHDWVPYAVSVAYVVVHHGLAGVLAPGTVYDHPTAIAHPWLWAGIHAFFVAGLSAALIVLWSLGEKAMRERDAALAQNAEHLALVSSTMDSTADGVLVVDREGKIRLYNRRFQSMWRIPDEVLASRDDDRAIARVMDQLKDPEAFLRKIQELYDHPEKESLDVLEFKDSRVFERYSKPHRVGGEVVGRVWSFHDATKRRDAEEEHLKNVTHMKEIENLKRLHEFQASFVNTAAHELNTPLTPIRIQLHLLGERLAKAGNGQDRASVLVLKRNFERFERLVDDLLDVARLEANKLEMARKEVDLAGLVEEVGRDMQGTFESKGIDLRVHVGLARPVYADLHRITQTLQNLLNNASRFTPAGGTVDLTVKSSARGAVVSVSDTGVGLSSAQISKLFLPFSQVRDPSKAQAGTGLGLYICKGIVELHGGSIWCESDGLGNGSTFRFCVPFYRKGMHAEASATQDARADLGGTSPVTA